MKNINVLIKNDIDVEASLELLGDMEMYNELVLDFHNEIKERIQLLKKYSIDELREYAVVAHSIKSDSKYLGFKKLAEVALSHELAAKDSNAKFISENLNVFIEEIDRVDKILTEYL